MLWIVATSIFIIVLTIVLILLLRKKKCTPKKCTNCNQDNGCGEKCTCPAGYVCTPNGTCCQPKCIGNCGDNGCGGSCGKCPAGYVCLSNGNCCLPKCIGNCGDDGCGGSCGKCPIGQSCNAGNCSNINIYGDLDAFSSEKQTVATSKEDCATQTKKFNYRFWTYDSQAVAQGGEVNCFMFNKAPKCSGSSVNGTSGDVQNSILPTNLPTNCSNSCIIQGQSTQVPQYQPNCGTDTGYIDIVTYGTLDGIIPIITDSCRSGSPSQGTPCTSSLQNSDNNFTVSKGTCQPVENTFGTYYVCIPNKFCSQTVLTENNGICISNQ